MEKQEIIKSFQRKEGDTGSPEVQIAILTTRIADLTTHLKAHPKDNHTRHGLLKLVGQRKRLLSYYQKKDLDGYRTLKEKLKLR